ncbi:hypothetical protein BMG523Draft_02353 [Frankia sp. BMG5.23]|nr:hypothetical protein BMG523Draft_02353 [Frankia sp. BMG5.23]
MDSSQQDECRIHIATSGKPAGVPEYSQRGGWLGMRRSGHRTLPARCVVSGASLRPSVDVTARSGPLRAASGGRLERSRTSTGQPTPPDRTTCHHHPEPGRSYLVIHGFPLGNRPPRLHHRTGAGLFRKAFPGRIRYSENPRHENRPAWNRPFWNRPFWNRPFWNRAFWNRVHRAALACSPAQVTCPRALLRYNRARRRPARCAGASRAFPRFGVVGQDGITRASAGKACGQR